MYIVIEKLNKLTKLRNLFLEPFLVFGSRK